MHLALPAIPLWSRLPVWTAQGPPVQQRPELLPEQLMALEAFRRAAVQTPVAATAAAAVPAVAVRAVVTAARCRETAVLQHQLGGGGCTAIQAAEVQAAAVAATSPAVARKLGLTEVVSRSPAVGGQSS